MQLRVQRVSYWRMKRFLIYKLNISQQKVSSVFSSQVMEWKKFQHLVSASTGVFLYLHCRGLQWIQAGSHTGQWCGGKGHCCARTGGRSGCSGVRRTPANRLEPERTNCHCCCPAISHPVEHLLLAWNWLCFPTPVVVAVICAAQWFTLPKQDLLPLLKDLVHSGSSWLCWHSITCQATLNLDDVWNAYILYLAEQGHLLKHIWSNRENSFISRWVRSWFLMCFLTWNSNSHNFTG